MADVAGRRAHPRRGSRSSTVDGVTMPGLIARFSAHARARSAAPAGRSAPTPRPCSPSSTPRRCRPGRTRDAPRSVGVENRTWMRAPTAPRGGCGQCDDAAFPTTVCGKPWGRRWTTGGRPAGLGTTVWTNGGPRRGRVRPVRRVGRVRCGAAGCPERRPQPGDSSPASSPGRPQPRPQPCPQTPGRRPDRRLRIRR